MRDGIAYLLHEEYTVDALLQRIPVIEKRMIYVTETSISRAEWNVATGNGVQPDIQLRTQRVNYCGETRVEYEGAVYYIYRTYTDDDYIELYLEKRQGVQNNEANND